MKTRDLLFILSIFFTFCYQNSFSQSYGLEFYSHEVVQDQRTGLDLSPKKTLCFDKDFELSFELNFVPKRDDYFGYIVRLVVNDDENIDLIYDKDNKEKNHFKIIAGDKFSKIAFNIPPDLLFNNWNTIKLKFDLQHSRLILNYGKFNSTAKIPLKKKDCFKILFGANEYQRFKTSDNPPMRIRNINIKEDGQLKYNWPLDEYDGSIVSESVNKNNALADNPLWVKKLHYEWKLLKNFVVNGAASVAFNAKTELLYIVARDSLKTLSINDKKLTSVAYQNKLNLPRGNHSLYDDENDRLLNLYTDQKRVSVFNSQNNTWSKYYDPNAPITDYWQINKFYSPKDSSLYVLGGYGHFIFRNEIQQYHFPSDTWKTVSVSGDTYTPRYLAALGFTGDGAYIIGGYGSSTGKQMLNPRNLYDLLYFDVKKKTIRKIYELKIHGEDFVFANSLIINKETKTFYGLTFPKHKYNSTLQMVEGSLNKPLYKIRGSKIPFEFHDINSYADLYYSPSSKKFIAVTTFRDSTDHTHVSVFTLNAPPLAVPDQLFARSKPLWYWIAAIIVAIIIFYLYLRRRKTRSVLKEKEDIQDNQSNLPVLPVAELSLPLTSLPLTPATLTSVPLTSALTKNSVFLFGDLQVFDDQGNEITKLFTPLIKELFLVVLLYTIRWGRGISSDKLKELLWFDKSIEKARNNRSVNIAKLKNIFDKMSNCEISNETGYWRINIDPKYTYVDYQEYFDIINDKNQLDKDKIVRLARIIKQGSFLSIVNYEWIDTFKAEISNEIIDTYLHFANSIGIEEDPELLIEIANYIFYFDSVNEDAMTIKCRALVHLGKHSLAKNTFESFCKEYKVLYNEAFDKSFGQVLNSDSI